MSISRQVTIAICVFGLGCTLVAQTLQVNIPLANYPQAVALNPFTDKVYVISEPTNQVTEIDGVTNAATTISLGTNQQEALDGALAINRSQITSMPWTA